MAFGVMLAKDFNPARVKNWDHTYVEPKMDGIRVIVKVFPDAIAYYSRNGRALDMFSHLDDELMETTKQLRKMLKDSIVLDGEMMGEDFGDVAGAIHRKNATAETTRYHPFIAIPHTAFLDGIDWHSQKYRLNQMHEAGLLVPAATKVSSVDEVKARYDKLRKANYEGAMVKDYKEPWIAKRTFAWMKMKDELTVDLKIVAFKEGTGKYQGTLGAVIVKYKGKLVPVSGMTDALRDDIWKRQNFYMGKTVEIAYHQETVHGSLRHPRWKRLRDDK